MINVLFIGDIVGESGRESVRKNLFKMRNFYDLVIANGENAAGGKGITRKIFEELLSFGIDVVTMGNHTFARKEIKEIINNPKIVRPLNYPEGNLGNGYSVFNIKGIVDVYIVNLLGRVFTVECMDCPFRTIERFIETNKEKAKVVIVDMHAETTSEKIAMGYFLDGRVSVMVGTHTHVQTNDAKILKQGTGYITDVGMCGPKNSVIGLVPEIIIKRYLLCTPQKFEVAQGGAIFNAVELKIDEVTGKCLEIKQIKLEDE